MSEPQLGERNTSELKKGGYHKYFYVSKIQIRIILASFFFIYYVPYSRLTIGWRTRFIKADTDCGFGQVRTATFSTADPCLAFIMKLESALNYKNIF